MIFITRATAMTNECVFIARGTVLLYYSSYVNVCIYVITMSMSSRNCHCMDAYIGSVIVQRFAQ